jgi:hypothetical protein
LPYVRGNASSVPQQVGESLFLTPVHVTFMKKSSTKEIMMLAVCGKKFLAVLLEWLKLANFKL